MPVFCRVWHLEVLKWLRAEGCPWDLTTCDYAVRGGHVEVLRWARENGCPWNAYTQDRAEWKLGYTDDLGNLVGPTWSDLAWSDDEYSDDDDDEETALWPPFL